MSYKGMVITLLVAVVLFIVDIELAGGQPWRTMA
jgi:hypothetical protein